MASHELRTVAVYENDMAAEAEQLKSRYEIDEGAVRIYDIVWGDEELNGPIFAELARHDALRRLQTVEQLTLPDRFKTIPGSTHFSRWEHAWGSAIFAGRVAREAGHDEAQVEQYQLRALLSDVCHTAHSHAGDWIIQGVGKHETYHDDRRLEYAEMIGVNEVLRRRGYDPAQLLGDDEDPLMDAKMPDLDVDRIDYTLREAYRWVDQIPGYRAHLNKDSFTVKDGKIVCRDKIAAKLFGISYTLLVTEHWQEPAHRLQLELFMESMKRTFVGRTSDGDEIATYSPIDYLMVTDDTLARLGERHDAYLPMMDELMRGVSESETNGRWHSRLDRIRKALEGGMGADSKSIEWLTAQYDKLPRSYEIDPDESSKLRNGQFSKVIKLARLRKRMVDPLYISSSGEVKRLSENHEGFRIYQAEAIGNVQKDWRAAIIGNKDSTKELKACVEENELSWPKVMDRPRMPKAILRQLIRETVRTSNGAAAQAIECNIH